MASLFTTSPSVAWTIRKADKDEWMVFTLKLKSIDRGPCPQFDKMKCDVLHWPSTEDHPVVDFYYKTEKGNLVAFQITRKQSEVNSVPELAYAKFLNQIGLKDSTKVSFILVPIPAMATTTFFTNIPCADESLLELTRDCLLAHINDMNYSRNSEKFRTKKDVVREFRRLQEEKEKENKKSFSSSSSSSSMIKWPEYHVLQVPKEYATCKFK